MNQQKTCQRCGRTIEWRKKWEDCWEEIKYCSTACRRKPADDQSRQIRSAIIAALQTRARGASLCPSEVARSLSPEAWRDWMEPVRQVARLLVAEGIVEITQNSRIVDPSTAKGPIRIRRGHGFPETGEFC